MSLESVVRDFRYAARNLRTAPAGAARREIGIRMALGALGANIVQLMLGRALVLATFGLLLGFASIARCVRLYMGSPP